MKQRLLLILFLSLFLVSCTKNRNVKEMTPFPTYKTSSATESTFENHFLKTKNYTIKITDTSIYPNEEKTDHLIVFTYEFTNKSKTSQQPSDCFENVFSISQESETEWTELNRIRISNQESPFYELGQVSQIKVKKGQTVVASNIYRLYDSTTLIFLKAFDPEDTQELGFEVFTPQSEAKNQKNQLIKE